jgi:hypothetical protein
VTRDRRADRGRDVTIGQAESAPGVVRVRLLGDTADADVLAAILAASPVIEVIDKSAPRLNRREAGVRLYFTVRITGPWKSGGVS